MAEYDIQMRDKEGKIVARLGEITAYRSIHNIANNTSVTLPIGLGNKSFVAMANTDSMGYFMFQSPVRIYMEGNNVRIVSQNGYNNTVVRGNF